MAKPHTTEAIAEWAGTQDEAKQAALSPKPKRRKLTQSDVGVLLKLHKDGLTQTQIAQRLGCDQTTVSGWIAKCSDTTDTAKSYLRGQALKMAQNIVNRGLAKDHVAALKGLSVLDEQTQQGLTIQIGGDGHDIRIGLLSPPNVTVISEG